MRLLFCSKHKKHSVRSQSTQYQLMNLQKTTSKFSVYRSMPCYFFYNKTTAKPRDTKG